MLTWVTKIKIYLYHYHIRYNKIQYLSNKWKLDYDNKNMKIINELLWNKLMYSIWICYVKDNNY